MQEKQVNPYIVALTVMLPTFMVLMDTSIVEDDWFNSNFIVILGLLSFFFISMFLIKNYFFRQTNY